MKYYVQLKYDTMKDASCGGVYEVEGPRYHDINSFKPLFDEIKKIEERLGCTNCKMVAIYLHNPCEDEIDDNLELYKKTNRTFLSDDLWRFLFK